MTPSTTSLVDLANLAEDRSYQRFASALGYEFENLTMLELALTHRSWCAENGSQTSNERLEFLGDAVLGLSITDSLFTNRPDQNEGDLAKARAEVVSAPSLAHLARTLGLGELVLLGHGEEQSGGRDKESILADAMEAVIGAVYLDAGWETAKAVVQRQFANAAKHAQGTPGERDFKTRLQEVAANGSLPAPEYEIVGTGPDHDRKFESVVRVGAIVGTGSGTSKKQAQQRAAEQALQLLEAETVTQ